MNYLIFCIIPPIKITILKDGGIMPDDTEITESSISLKEFFESVPPGKWAMVNVKDNVIEHFRKNTTFKIGMPLLELFCEKCKGPRSFESSDNAYTRPTSDSHEFIEYECNNCVETPRSSKVYALHIKHPPGLPPTWFIHKFGELPHFGPPLPPKLITLIRSDRELFSTGRRAENQGMGIGAFAYYRRVVENQKNRIFDEIIKVVHKISKDDPILKELEDAKKEKQFTTSVDKINRAIPHTLMIEGRNPLTLLYVPLSKGIHELSEDDCLKYAHSIRLVLAEFAEKLDQALKESKKINDAVTHLLESRSI